MATDDNYPAGHYGRRRCVCVLADPTDGDCVVVPANRGVHFLSLKLTLYPQIEFKDLCSFLEWVWWLWPNGSPKEADGEIILRTGEEKKNTSLSCLSSVHCVFLEFWNMFVLSLYIFLLFIYFFTILLRQWKSLQRKTLSY